MLVVYLGGRAGTLPAGADAHGDPSPDEAARLTAALDGVLPGFAAARNDVALRSAWAADPWARGSYSCRRPGQLTGFGDLSTRQGPFLFAGEHVAHGATAYMNSAVESGFDAAVAGAGGGGGCRPEGWSYGGVVVAHDDREARRRRSPAATRSLRSLNSDPSSGRGTASDSTVLLCCSALARQQQSRSSRSLSPYAPSSPRGRARSRLQ